MKLRLFVLLFLLVLMLWSSVCPAGVSVSQLSYAVHKVEQARNPNVQNDAVRNLYKIAVKLNKDQISTEDVDLVASLLHSDNEVVVYWAASALGKFGKISRRVLPLLYSSLRKYACVVGYGKSAATGVSLAIHEITGNPVIDYYKVYCVSGRINGV